MKNQKLRNLKCLKHLKILSLSKQYWKRVTWRLSSIEHIGYTTYDSHSLTETESVESPLIINNTSLSDINTRATERVMRRPIILVICWVVDNCRNIYKLGRTHVQLRLYLFRMSRVRVFNLEDCSVNNTLTQRDTLFTLSYDCFSIRQANTVSLLLLNY